MRSSSFGVLLLSLAPFAQALLPDGRVHGNIPPRATVPVVPMSDHVGPVVSRSGNELPPYNMTYYFDQLKDHNNPQLGTFKQRFWFTYEFYEPGGPIVLFPPGEVNAASYTAYLTNKTITGTIAQQFNGSNVVLEHRFFGLSNPYDDLSDQSLRLLTLQQSIDDLEYFVKNVKLPMPGGDKFTPDKAPWIIVGGSYSGALTSWTMVNKPGLFHIGYATSAVVQAITDFWQYFDPIRRHMPSNCSADVQAVIAHIDDVFTHSDPNSPEVRDIKSNFGLANVTHLDDVAGALRNNLWDWQSISPSTGPNTTFQAFCDALEVKDGVNAGPDGWGLDHALNAWGKFWNTTYYREVCGRQDAETCLGTYDPTQDFWTDTSINNSGRSWTWFVCNEVGFFQEGAPEGTPSVVTRLVTPAYDERQCTYWFPQAFPKPRAPSVDAVNKAYAGWDVNIERLFFANGERDPWLDATVSSTFHQRESTPPQPIAIGGGYHCSDLSIANGKADPSVAAVQQEGLLKIAEWLPEFKPQLEKREVEHDVTNDSPMIKPINAWFRGMQVDEAAIA